MQTYRKIRHARMKAAGRRLRRKQLRWRGKVIIRGSGKGGGNQCTAQQRMHMTASQLKRKHG